MASPAPSAAPAQGSKYQTKASAQPVAQAKSEDEEDEKDEAGKEKDDESGEYRSSLRYLSQLNR